MTEALLRKEEPIISIKQRGKLIEMFVAGATARWTTKITGVYRQTVEAHRETVQAITNGL